METKDLDWGNIGFNYRITDYRYISNYKDGNWDDGELSPDSNVTINESAGILQYCQEVFEGLRRTGQRKDISSHSDRNLMQRECMIRQRDLRCLRSLKIDSLRLLIR